MKRTERAVRRRERKVAKRNERRGRIHDPSVATTTRKHRNYDEGEQPNIEKTHIQIGTFPPLKDKHLQFDEAYYANSFLLGIGCAGTGKTFRAVYHALRDVFNPALPFDRIIFIRTTVAVRDQGHLPGDEGEKSAPYERPFIALVNEICGRDDAYGILKKKGIIEFRSTSHEQGLTYKNAIIVADEIQNYNFKELDMIATRRGKECKIIAVGDFVQDYVTSNKEKSGLNEWLQIMEIMQQEGDAAIINFTEDDIVRDNWVAKYIKTRNRLGIAA